MLTLHMGLLTVVIWAAVGVLVLPLLTDLSLVVQVKLSIFICKTHAHKRSLLTVAIHSRAHTPHTLVNILTNTTNTSAGILHVSKTVTTHCLWSHCLSLCWQLTWQKERHKQLIMTGVCVSVCVLDVCQRAGKRQQSGVDMWDRLENERNRRLKAKFKSKHSKEFSHTVSHHGYHQSGSIKILAHQGLGFLLIGCWQLCSLKTQSH